MRNESGCPLLAAGDQTIQRWRGGFPTRQIIGGGRIAYHEQFQRRRFFGLAAADGRKRGIFPPC